MRWAITRLPVAGHGPASYAEPGIVVGRRGLVVVDAASANTGAPPTFWISRDGGLSWSTGRDVDPSGASTGDADAAIAGDGRLYALNLAYGSSSNPNPTVSVYRSTDGLRWSGPASFPAPHGADQPDRPWLIVDPRHPADVDVVNSEASGNFVIWRSSDHGAAFSGPDAVGGGANLQAVLALSSRPLFDPARDGRMFMAYVTATPAGALGLIGAGTPLYEFPMTQLWLASSENAGRVWANRLVLDTATLPGPLHDATIGHLLPAAAVDRAGDLYVAISARPSGGTRTSIWLMHSGDGGTSWSPPLELPAPTASNVMPALAVTPSGGAAYLSWYGSNAEDFRSASARWTEMFASVSRPLAARPAVSVSRVGGRPVHVGGIDTAGTIGSDLGADWSLRDFQSIAVDARGRPHLVWASDAGAPATETALPAPRRAHRHVRH